MSQSLPPHLGSVCTGGPASRSNRMNAVQILYNFFLFFCNFLPRSRFELIAREEFDMSSVNVIYLQFFAANINKIKKKYQNIYTYKNVYGYAVCHEW